MKFFTLFALATVASAIQMVDVVKTPNKDVANKNIDPWVHDYVKANVLPYAYPRSDDKEPTKGTYPPYGT